MTRNLLAGVVLGTLAVGMANGAIRFHGSGSWDMLEGVGQPEGWQSATPPGTGDTVRANWGNNTVTLNYATTVAAFQAGVDEGGTFHIQSGGNLTAGNSKVGNNGSVTGQLVVDAGGVVNANGGWLMIAGNSDVTGIADITGTLNSAGHLWMATGAASTASLIINLGGLVDVNGMLGLGTVNAVDPSGGIATITVNNGGILDLAQLHGGGTSVQPGSMINLLGSGQIQMTGNFAGHFNDATNGYITNGYISGDGVVGNVTAEFNSGSGLTTVTVIPEPSSLGLLGAFATFGLLLRRRS